MIFYLTQQIRGEAGPLQAQNVSHALAHNVGLGGSCVVSILRKPAFYKKGSTGAQRFGYDMAAEVRGVSQADLAKVRSKHYSNFVVSQLEPKAAAATPARL
jgi:sterol carrier protein 2